MRRRDYYRIESSSYFKYAIYRGLGAISSTYKSRLYVSAFDVYVVN